uniref:Uncharacterized protein n=1 Tax=Ciona intestinalis TaxID=7719 RepID=H2XW36_CIOIN
MVKHYHAYSSLFSFFNFCTSLLSVSSKFCTFSSLKYSTSCILFSLCCSVKLSSPSSNPTSLSISCACNKAFCLSSSFKTSSIFSSSFRFLSP